MEQVFRYAALAVIGAKPLLGPAAAFADAAFPPPLYPDAGNAAQPSAQQNLGIGLGSGLAPGSTSKVAGGAGYAVGDSLTLDCSGCSFTTRPVVAVTAVSGGAITGWVVTNPGMATKVPANTPTPTLTQLATSGAGSGASFTGVFAPIAAMLSVPALSNTGGTASNGNLFITAESPQATLGGVENTFVGDRAGGNFTGAASAITAVGHNACGIGAGTLISTVSYATCLGNDAARNVGSGANAITAVGQNALRNVNGGYSVAVGASAGTSVTTGSFLSLFGYQVGSTTLQTGSHVLLLGTSSAVDTPAANTSNYLNIENIVTTTGTDTPASSTTTIAGTLNAKVPSVNGISCPTGFSLDYAGCYQVQTASGASSLSFAGLANDEYALRCRHIVPSNNNAAIVLRYGTGTTPTFQTANYSWALRGEDSAPSANPQSGSGSDVGINLTSSILSNTANYGLSFVANFSDFTSASVSKKAYGVLNMRDVNGPTAAAVFGGDWTGDLTAPITGVQVAVIGGTFSGTCTLRVIPN